MTTGTDTTALAAAGREAPKSTPPPAPGGPGPTVATPPGPGPDPLPGPGAEAAPGPAPAEPAPAEPAPTEPAPAGAARTSAAEAGAATAEPALAGVAGVGAATAETPPAGAGSARAYAAAVAVVRALRAVAVRTAAVLALVAVWEAAPRLGLVDATFLPPISEVAAAWWGLAGDGQLADHTQASLVRSFGGFGIAVAVAVPLGLLIGWYRPLADFLGPLLEVFRNTAALALLPVFVLLLGIGETSKVSIVVYACLWPVLLNTISAVRGADPTLVRLARSMDLSTLRLFQKVILPASVPTVFTGIRLAGAVSILVLVAAEMIGAKAGLGYLINASQYNFAIPQMYAGIITISAIGVAFNQLLVTVERRLSLWRVPA
ncbi:ABC transporter permease [Streptomyces sp. NPDC091371]|uniref:ABC transporter permease n=1 Tax=Streptomyces sp. NPDC091371 TaxID=3155303 RepID=UPI00343F9C57